MKHIKLLILTLATVFSAYTAVAQNVKVSGTVTDENGPLPGAAVMVQGTSNGTMTDVDGSYTITVASNATLVFTSVGYEDVVEPVSGRNVINVRMTISSELIEETVVIGYGSGQKVANLVGSVKTVKSETLSNAPSASALDMLQGQVAGLSVLTTGGVAGDNNVSMTLHGVGSLTSSTEPLFVIDGIPSSSRTIMAMNPNDILSISVLKDASATSIYGSRAANGVVYVTTKAGSYNEKATVTYRGQYGISTLADFTMYNNMMTGDQLKDFWIRAGLYTYEQIQSTYTDHGYTANTKWHNYYQQFNNPQYQNDLTIEGGGRRVAYMIAASQFHQRGNTIGNWYDRYTLRSNVQAHPTNWLKVGVNINFSLDKRNSNGSWGDGANAGGNNYLAGGLSMILNPLYPAIDPVTGEVYEKFPWTAGTGAINQKYQYTQITRVTDRYGVVGSTFVEIEPVKNLKLVSRAGIDGSETLFNYAQPVNYSTKYGLTPGHSRSSTFQYSATITNTIEYTMNFGRDHKASILAGHEGIKNFYDYFWAYSAKQTDDRLMELDHGTQATYDMSESKSESAFLSFFGHADYSFADRYFFDATVRYDASSRFGRDNRWAPFWAVGFLWKAKNEAFLRNVRWINALNVKVSYGTQGNAGIGNYTQYATIGQTSEYNGVSGLAITSPSNYGLKWEQQGLLTFTLGGRIFDRFDFDFEFYDRRTTNMLMSVPQPYTTGFASGVTSNVGGLSNRGIDITLGVDILRGRDYYLRANATFNYNREIITELFDGRQEWEIANTGITYVVGKPISFYYPIFAGIDPEDGKQMWYVPTGWEEYQETGDPSVIDKNTTRMDKTTKDFDENLLNQNTGKVRNAPINGGFGIAGGWKGFAVQADFSYVLGKYLINNDAFFYNNPNQFLGYNASKAVTDYWTPENKYAAYPDWSTGATMQFDTHLLESASFLRLKSLLVSYSLPKKALNWTNGVLKGVKFTFTGRNLFTVTKYMGADPEVDSNLTLGLPGNTKQFLGGIELTF
jgi:TonB-linked SusC/RagA family outer membrane protein